MSVGNASHPIRLAQGVEGTDRSAVLEQALATLRSQQGQDLSSRQQREHRALAGQVFLWRLNLPVGQRRGEQALIQRQRARVLQFVEADAGAHPIDAWQLRQRAQQKV